MEADKIKMLKVEENQHTNIKRMVLEDSNPESTLEQLVFNLLNEAIEARKLKNLAKQES